MRESDELVSAFTGLEAFVRETSRLPGLAAAQAEADRRRRGRIAVWSTAAAVVLVLGGAATAVAGWLPRSGVTGLDPSPSWSGIVDYLRLPVVVGHDGADAPAVRHHPGARALRHHRPTPSGAVLADMTPPEQIPNVTIDVPAFDLAGCPSGRLPFVDASGAPDGAVSMEYAAVGDIDGNGVDDIVVALRCGPPLVSTASSGLRWSPTPARR